MSYWGDSIAANTTIKASPAPTTTGCDVNSTADLFINQIVMIEVSAAYETTTITSISGDSITFSPALSGAPDVPGSLISQDELITNTKLNNGAVFHADDVATVKAIPTTDAPENLRYQVPGLGILRLDKASTATADDLFIYAPDTGPGRWILEVGKQNDRWGKLTTATERTVQTFGGTEYVCKATVDASSVSAGNVSVYADSALVQTFAATEKDYVMFDADTDVEVRAENILFDIDSATYEDNVGINNPWGIFMRPTEDKFFTVGNSFSSLVLVYTCTAGDISTASAVSAENFDVGNGRGLFFKPDGTEMYVCINNQIKQYTLSTAWNPSTAGAATTYTSPSFTDAQGMFISPDGLHCFVVEDNGTSNRVYQLAFGTAWDVSTLSDVTDVSVNTQTSGQAYDIMLNSTGTKLYVLGNSTDAIFQYSLSTAWTLSTISYDSLSLNVSGQDGDMRGLCMVNDLRFYAVGDANDDAYQYTIGTEFTGTARYQLEYGVAA